MDKKGLTIGDIILVVNVILKLAGLITWSWWVVLWPLWFTIIVFIILTIATR